MRHASGASSLSLLALAAVAAIARPLAGQLPPERPVQWTLTGPASSDGRIRLRLAATMAPGWYIYSLTQGPGGPYPTRVALAPGGRLVQDGAVQAPPPARYEDPNFGIETETYHGGVAFLIPARPGADTGNAAALVRYQTCNDHTCLPPHTDTVPLGRATKAGGTPAGGAAGVARSGPGGAAETTPAAGGMNTGPGGVRETTPTAGDAGVAGVGGSAAGAAGGAPGAGAFPAVAPGPGPEGAAVGPGVSGAPAVAPAAGAAGVLPVTGTVSSPAAFLWLAAIMGLLSLLTPCVFPMVPITIAFFARGRGDAAAEAPRSRSRTLVNAAAYAVGIVGAFCGAGVLLTLLLGAGGVLRLAANPWLNLAVTALFLAFALNLLGAYEVRLPAGLMQRLGAGSDGHGPGAALLLGAAFAVTTFTCTAPFVGTLLVVAARGDWTWPLLGMLVFALAFALPFFLLALLPELLARLPRSGGWMLTLRRALGVLEIAAAAKFISNTDLVLGWHIFTREVVIAIWATAALALALVILGRPGAPRRPGRLLALGRAALVLLSIGGAWWMLTGLRGARLGEMEAFLPPPAAGAVAGDELPWVLNDFQGSLARARAERRPLFIDFTGYTCTNCRWMEANMFPRPDVRAWLDEFMRVRLYTDGEGEPYAGQQALERRLFGTVALPVYAVLTPAGEPVATFVGMTRSSQEFGDFLARGLEAARARDSTPAAREAARAAKVREAARSLLLDQLWSNARPLPAFTLQRLGGGRFSSDALKGRVAVINFWGTWCPPCVRELPLIQRLYDRYRDDPGVVVLTIDAERDLRDPQQVAARFVRERNFTFPVLLADSALVDLIPGFPTTLYIDRQGLIADLDYGRVWLRALDPLDPFVWRIEALKGAAALGRTAPAAAPTREFRLP